MGTNAISLNMWLLHWKRRRTLNFNQTKASFFHKKKKKKEIENYKDTLGMIHFPITIEVYF